MSDVPILAEYGGTVTLTIRIDDALVMRDFLGLLCTDDFQKGLVYRLSIPPTAQHVSRKFYKALMDGADASPKAPSAS